MSLRSFLSSYAIPIGIAVGLIWVWARARSHGHKVTSIEPTDPLWTRAIQQASETIPIMRDRFAQQQAAMLVKYPLKTDSGQIEHVWGQLTALNDSTMTVTLATEPINFVSAQPPFHIPIADLEDWQFVVPTGQIRGGFTTQAQIAIAKKSGSPLPSHIAELEPHFVDRLSVAT